MENVENVKFNHHLLNKMLDYSAKTDDVKCKMRRPCPTGMLWMTPTESSRGREQGWYICDSQRQCHSILIWWSQGEGRSVWYRTSTLPYCGNQIKWTRKQWFLLMFVSTCGFIFMWSVGLWCLCSPMSSNCGIFKPINFFTLILIYSIASQSETGNLLQQLEQLLGIQTARLQYHDCFYTDCTILLVFLSPF